MNFESKESLSAYYAYLQNVIRQSSQTPVDRFKEFTISSLLQTDTWHKALATLEWAIESLPEASETKAFFELIFRGYDHYASVDLNDTDYDWYWNKIHALFDLYVSYQPVAGIEKALQYYAARRGYADKKKTLYYLEKGKENNDDVSCVLLGYYLYLGFCGETDKIKGMELMNSAMTDEGKVRAAIYKGYIAINENRLEEAKASLDKLEKENPVPDMIRHIYELRAYVLEIDGNVEEAILYYQKAFNETHAAGFSLSRIAFLHYNKRLQASKDEREALAMMEEAVRLGRVEVSRSLYYCLFDSGTEWQDNEKGFYWLMKGYQYSDDYCTAELAYLYLYNDAYKDVTKGLAYLNEAVEMNYAGALLTKAYHYYNGDILEKSIPGCLNLLDRAVALGNGVAAYRAGVLYETGEATENDEPDYAKALAYYEKGAELNDGQACGYAGRYYLVGLSVDQNYDKAKEYYEKGASYGNLYSIVELAIMYQEGTGVEEDQIKAFELLKQASEQDYAHAWYLLGRCYKYELGTDENPDEAIACFENAAKQEHAKALAELGYIYETGYGVEYDGKKAFDYMQQAANQSYGYAEYKVGSYYMYGLEGALTVDYPKAVEWLTKAIENDHPYAMLEMGDYYLYNYAGTDERQKAFDYYVRAAEQECVNEGLGLCYEYGFGVEINDGEAFKYYLKAAEDGYVRAKHNVAVCYYYGIGVKENFSEAYRWFNDAAASEYADSVYYKAKMLLAGEGTTQDIPEGVSLMKQAAEAGGRDAQFELGNCYLVGKGVEENEDLAMEWFEKAAENGHEQALKVTGRRRRR